MIRIDRSQSGLVTEFGYTIPWSLDRNCHGSHANDRVLARHYGFTDEELDFIPSTLLRAGINYGIKYRMGQSSEEGE